MKHKLASTQLILIGIFGLSAATPAMEQSESFTMPIEGEVVEGCQISATPMHFGLITGQTSRPTTTATISLLCNPNTNYVISIDLGQQPNGQQRRMRNPVNGRHLRYRIYRNAGMTQRWSTRNNRRLSGNSGATGIVSHTAYGQIRNNNAGTRTGQYFDTVTVSVEF